MKTREDIVDWLADLERIIDQSLLAMNASEARIEALEAQIAEDTIRLKEDTDVMVEATARIEKLEAALREITAAHGIGGPAMQAIARAALAPEQK